jgi:hypothetical protein
MLDFHRFPVVPAAKMGLSGMGTSESVIEIAPITENDTILTESSGRLPTVITPDTSD